MAGIGLVAALGIEVAQIFIPGRAPTWRDAVLNGIGAGLGAWVARDILAWLNGRWTSVLSWGAVGVALGAVSATGWLLQPASPSSQWFGQWSPRLAHLEPWDGRVTAASIGNFAVTHGALQPSAPVHDALRQRRPIEVRGTFQSAPDRLAAIFAISDDEFEEVLLVGQEGPTLVFRERRRASTFRLFEPEFRFPAFLGSVEAGEPFTLRITHRSTTTCAELQLSSRSDSACAERFPASSLWTFVLWRRWMGGDTRRLFGALTFATLLVPVGFFAAPMRGARKALPPVAAAAGLVVLAPLVGLAAVVAWEAAGIVVGATLGMIGGRRALTSAR